MAVESLSGKNLAIIVAVSIVFLILLAVSGETLLNALVVICSLFLICLVLIQRGRGGGLAGAFGGMGGSSAFGTKAGDVFTWTTIVTAVIWFMIAMRLVMLSNTQGPSNIFGDRPGASREVPLTTDGSAASKAVNDAIEKAKAGILPAPAVPAPADTTGLPPALEDETKPAASAPAPAPTSTPVVTPEPAPATPSAPAPEPAKTP
jgi:preprotein translocase subunit SecG